MNYTLGSTGSFMHMLSVNYKFVAEFIQKKQAITCHAILKDRGGKDVGTTRPIFVIFAKNDRELALDRKVTIECSEQTEQVVLFVYYTRLGMCLFFHQAAPNSVNKGDSFVLPSGFLLETD